jgi:hypothetical protein
MLIEYQIKFTKNGLTITQQIDENTAGTTEPLVQGNSLLANIQESHAANAEKPEATGPPVGGSPINRPGGGGGVPPGTSAPTIIIGPIFFGCCPTHEDEDTNKKKD